MTEIAARASDRSLVWNSDLITVVAAEDRHESRGAYAHEDLPDRHDQNWRVHSLAYVDGPVVRLATRPVHADPLTPLDQDGIDPKKIASNARVY